MSYGTPPPCEYFVTPMIVKVVYMLSIVGLGIAWMVLLAAAFAVANPPAYVVYIPGIHGPRGIRGVQ